jgi:hypothetical protein
MALTRSDFLRLLGPEFHGNNAVKKTIKSVRKNGHIFLVADSCEAVINDKNLNITLRDSSNSQTLNAVVE